MNEPVPPGAEARHSAENDRPDCRCPLPKPNGRGECSTCARFACEYADRGQTRCSPAICDCFIDTYPDSPRDLHPEGFIVGRVISPAETTGSEDPA